MSTDTDVKNIIFSYQGSFGPPTYGHYKSMIAFAENLSKEYLGDIRMYFMMSPGGSKNHLFKTIDLRRKVLQNFCDILNIEKNNNKEIENKNISFYVGEHEIKIANGEDKSIHTIDTINELIIERDKLNNSNENEKYEICLGMGLDNAFQLPYWSKIDEYSKNVHKIYIVKRDLTKEDEEKTRLFEVKHKNPDTIVEMRFDVTVPWTNTTFLKCFLPDNNNNITLQKGEKDNLIKKLISVNNNGKEPYKFYQSLPRIVVIDKKIPATSSSMLRYFIYNYLSEENIIIKGKYLEKIKNIMFGPTSQDQEQLLVLVMDTINDYKTKEIFNNNNIPFDKNYENEYNNIKFQGGNNKTKSRRANKKRKSQKKIYNKILPYYVGTRKNQKNHSNKKFRTLRKHSLKYK
jgi:nicotinic acid mononucleotide adenylyltransferase